MFKKIFGLLFIAGLALAACKKEETPAPTPTPTPQPTKTEMLAKIWKPDSVFQNGLNLTGLFATTRFTFRTDNKYIMTTPVGPDTGVWAFANNESQIILDPGPDQEVWNIQTLTNVLLRVRATNDDGEFRAQFSPAQ